MKRLLPVFALLAAVATACADATSPLAMCLRLEKRIAAGDGITLPDAEREIARFAGTVDLSRGDWPETFFAHEGETVCVAVSPFTGNYEFFDNAW